MADGTKQPEQNNRPNTADEYRKERAAFVDELAKSKVGIGRAIQHAVFSLWAIAIELAEANSRDREAEIRAKSAEAFVAGIQEQLAKQHIVIPGGSVQATPPRGR